MPSNFSFHRQPASLSSANPDARLFPEIGGPEANLLTFRDRIINPWSQYWNYHMARIGLSMSYFLGRQWASLDIDTVFEGVRGVAIRQAIDDGEVRPVTNELDPAVEQEVIALVKRKWTPKVTPSSDDPRIKAAAQVSNDQLNYRLEQIAWREKRHRTGLIFATGGISHLWTAWDKSYYDLRPEPSPDAVYCPAEGCSTVLFSPDVPVSTLRQGMPRQGGGFDPVQHLSTAKPVYPDPNDFASTTDEMATLRYCPTCPEPSQLRPIAEMNNGEGMPEEMAASGADPFGRPLGVDVPRGQTSLEVDLPWERYPQNGGALCEPDTVVLLGRRKIRSLEWIEERYPHLVGDIDPDPITELLYSDPLLGGGGFFNNYSPSLDVGILDFHNNVDELIRLPSFRYPHGRYAVMTKDKVLEDGPLLEMAKVTNVHGETEYVYVPRVQDSAARYKLRPNEYWGTTIADNEISKQNRLNGLDAQIIETRLRMGPNILVPSDMWPAEGVDALPIAGVGNIVQLNPSIQNPQARPEVFQGVLMPADIYMERDRVQADIRRGIGPAEAATGQPVKNVGTTSGLQLLVDQDEKSRSLREDELVNSAERAWTHLQRLEWALRVDDDVYRVLGPNKAWKYTQYRGNVFRGQVEVTIERGSFIGKSVMRREAARELLADKLVNPNDPVTRRKLVEAYGFEDFDLNQDTSNQVDHAERVWVDFVDKQIVRVQDMVDDPIIHYAVLVAHIRSDEGEQLADAAHWDDFQRKISGWEDKLRELVQLEAQSIAFYGTRLVGKAAAEAYAQATVAYDQQKAVYAQQLEVFKAHQAAQGERDAAASADAVAAGPGAAPAPSATPPPVAPIAPTPPPPPVTAPVLMQDRVYTVWMGMVQEQEGVPPTGATTETVPPQPPPEEAAEGEPANLPPPQPGDVDDTLAPPAPVDPGEVYRKFRALLTSYKLAASMLMAPPMQPSPGAGPDVGVSISAQAPGGAPGGGQPNAPAKLNPAPEGGKH